MSITFSSDIDASCADVFAWHERPGAFTRLVPPWQRLELLKEAESLKDGTAILKLPGGLKWVAQHDANAFVHPTQFVDEIANLRLPWRHTHTLEAVGDRTRMTDHVETPIPGRLLKPGFIYRHRQLRDDLAAHQRAALDPMTIAISGSTGLVGAQLTAFLTTGGHKVIRLVRHQSTKPNERQWNPDNPASDLLDGVDAVIHLAGESIAGHFTRKHKAKIYDSRVDPTRKLAEVATNCTVFVSASAIGFYGSDRGDEILTEASERGDGFLADVVADWEAASQNFPNRRVVVRTGIVQSSRGGTLKLMLPIFKAGIGGKLGDGHQWFSWIGLDDLIDVYHRALYDDQLSGPVNAVAPNPVRNSQFTKTLARVLNRPALLPVPKFGPAILLGKEGAEELAFANQHVVPTILVNHDHQFRRGELEPALRHEVGRFQEQAQ